MIPLSVLPLQAVEANLLNDPYRFPIGVWLQSPSNAPRFKAAGMNLYVGLWDGPTDQQLATLQTAGMPVICEQNSVGLAHVQDPNILGWLQPDEPDNAQPKGNGYGPCVPPQTVVDWYRKLKANDPNRPVLLGMGQGVANDQWLGRGSGASLDDYKTYVKGGDIVSFDIYPVSGLPMSDSENYLWYLPKGIDRLAAWAGPTKPHWNCIECTGIDSGKKATPEQVRAEVWMSLIHGSSGIIYFVHQFKPAFKEAALLDDPEMLQEVTSTNAEIQKLAPVLHSPLTTPKVTVQCSNPQCPVDFLVKRRGRDMYLFAVGMRNLSTDATFRIDGLSIGKVQNLDREGGLDARSGSFLDHFKPYEVHLYRISTVKTNSR